MSFRNSPSAEKEGCEGAEHRVSAPLYPHGGISMRHKQIWAWIACLALLTSCLSGCSLFGNRKNGETVQTSLTQEPASAAAEHSDASSDETKDTTTEEQAEPATPNQVIDTDNQMDTIVAAEPDTDVELPEIEIPVVPSDTMKPDNEGADIHEPVSTPQSPAPIVTEPEASNLPQQEPETQPDPGNSDIVVDHNGDILLPEVP